MPVEDPDGSRNYLYAIHQRMAVPALGAQVQPTAQTDEEGLGVSAKKPQICHRPELEPREFAILTRKPLPRVCHRFNLRFAYGFYVSSGTQVLLYRIVFGLECTAR